MPLHYYLNVVSYYKHDKCKCSTIYYMDIKAKNNHKIQVKRGKKIRIGKTGQVR